MLDKITSKGYYVFTSIYLLSRMLSSPHKFPKLHVIIHPHFIECLKKCDKSILTPVPSFLYSISSVLFILLFNFNVSSQLVGYGVCSTEKIYSKKKSGLVETHCMQISSGPYPLVTSCLNSTTYGREFKE